MRTSDRIFCVTVNLRRQTKACPERSEEPLDTPEYAGLIDALEGARYFSWRMYPDPFAVILSAAKDLALVFCLERPNQGEMLREVYPEPLRSRSGPFAAEWRTGSA